MQNTISKKIADLRIKANYTQEELSKLLNVCRYSVSLWERGVRFPSYNVLRLLSKIGQEYGIDFIEDEIFKTRRVKTIIRKKKV